MLLIHDPANIFYGSIVTPVSDPKANRGYVKQGRERVTNSTDPEEIAELRRTAPDVKESMEIGLETGPPFLLYGQILHDPLKSSCRSNISKSVATHRGGPTIPVNDDQILRHLPQTALRCASGGCSWLGYVRNCLSQRNYLFRGRRHGRALLRFIERPIMAYPSPLELSSGRKKISGRRRAIKGWCPLRCCFLSKLKV